MAFLPDVILIGQFPLATGALTALLGGVLAYLFGGWLAQREALGADGVQDAVVNLGLGGLLAAKLIYVAMDPGAYLANPAALAIFPYGPLALPAGAVGGAALVAWGMRKQRERLRVLDLLAPSLAVGLTVAAVGFKGPGMWAFTPLLGIATVAALFVGRGAPGAGREPGYRAAATVVLLAAAVVLADLARPVSGAVGGISGLQLAAALAGTGAWLWSRRTA